MKYQMILLSFQKSLRKFLSLKDIVFACTEAATEVNISVNCIITVVDAAMYPIFMEVSGEFYQRHPCLKSTGAIFAKPWDEMDKLELLQVAEETGLDYCQNFPHEHKHGHGHHHDNEGFQSCPFKTDNVWIDQEIRDNS
ncbi:MAG: hypothetical protein AAGU27_02265 [Dehalobacterium sp.]